MSESKIVPLTQAISDFRRARRQADLQQVMARLTSQPQGLLSYEEVRRALRAENRIERGLQQIPVAAIVGSVGRYRDFTRSFLPLSDSMEERWARVKAAAVADGGWPPIEVFQLGDAYFVIDGNHRVSVARQLDMPTIEAYVTEVETEVPLSLDTRPDDLIRKARYADFLKRTRLKQLRPAAEVNATTADAYDELEEHIAVHKYFMGIEQQRDIPDEEAVAHWYDAVFLPLVRIIEEKGLLHDFPNRTPTDLYVWIGRHRAELEELLGWEVTPETAAEDLARRHSSTPGRVLARAEEKLLDAILPDQLESGAAPGAWRQERLRGRRDDRLFMDVLVPLNGTPAGWVALEQALVLAVREGSRVRGLHVVPEGTPRNKPDIVQIRDQFARRCQEAGVGSRFVVDEGKVGTVITRRARWNDLVVLSLLHPPAAQTLSRLTSGFRSLVQRSPRPILAAPQVTSPLDRGLLAYDGSPKAQEALFIAAYLCRSWSTNLVVVTVSANGSKAEAQAVKLHARDYLDEHGIAATYVTGQGIPADIILEEAVNHDCDFLLLGGYNSQPLVEVVLGSTANELLRRSPVPLFLCQ